jgi:hypothetical protein
MSPFVRRGDIINLISFVTGLSISKKLFGYNEHEKLSNIPFRHTLKYIS